MGDKCELLTKTLSETVENSGNTVSNERYLEVLTYRTFSDSKQNLSQKLWKEVDTDTKKFKGQWHTYINGFSSETSLEIGPKLHLEVVLPETENSDEISLKRGRNIYTSFKLIFIN